MKMLVSDYDKTFYTNDIDIEINKKYVNEFRDRKNIFVFATGRSYSDFLSVKEKYNLEYDYLILNHGSLIMDSKKNILKYDIIDRNIINSIKNELNLDKSISNFCSSIISDRANFDDENIIKINAKYNDLDLVKEIKKNILEKYNKSVNAFLASKRTIEVVSKKSSKVNGVKFLSDKLNINKNDIYTIGDGESDIELIDKYNGFSMYESVGELDHYKKYNNVYSLIKDIMEEKGIK